MGGVVFSIVALPIGWIADIKGVRNIYLLLLLGATLSPLLYALSYNWQLTLIPIILGFVNMGSFQMLEWAIIANSTRRKERAEGFGIYFAVSGVALVIAPLLAGILLDKTGGLQLLSLRNLYFIQFIVMAISFIWVYFKLEDMKRITSSIEGNNSIKDLLEVLKVRRIKRWLMVELSGSVCVRDGSALCNALPGTD